MPLVTQDRREARAHFDSKRSALMRHVDGTFYVFSPAIAALGHHTANVAPSVRPS